MTYCRRTYICRKRIQSILYTVIFFSNIFFRRLSTNMSNTIHILYGFFFFSPKSLYCISDFINNIYIYSKLSPYSLTYFINSVNMKLTRFYNNYSMEIETKFTRKSIRKSFGKKNHPYNKIINK